MPKGASPLPCHISFSKIFGDSKSVVITNPPLRFQGLEAGPISCVFTPLDTFQSYLFSRRAFLEFQIHYLSIIIYTIIYMQNHHHV